MSARNCTSEPSGIARFISNTWWTPPPPNSPSPDETEARALSTGRTCSAALDDITTTSPFSSNMRRIGRFADDRSVHFQSSLGSSALRRSAGSHAAASNIAFMVRFTTARAPDRSCRLPCSAGTNSAAVARTSYFPGRRFAIRYRPWRSVSALPTSEESLPIT